MAQDREDPPLGDLHTDFDFGFVFRVGCARRQHDGATVAREVGRRPVDLRLVVVRGGHAALQVVRDPDRRAAAEVLHHAHVRADPRRQILTARGLRIDQAARPEHADEEFDDDDLARRRIHQRRALPGEIDEELLARAMHLAHRRFQRPCPPPIPLTKLAVPVPSRMPRAILQPQQRERHARLLQFLVQLTPIGDHPIAGRPDRRSRKHARFQSGVIHVVREGPRQARRRHTLQVRGDRAQPHRARLRDRAVTETGVMFEAE